MRGFDHATILSPSFYGLRKELQAQRPPICVQRNALQIISLAAYASEANKTWITAD